MISAPPLDGGSNVTRADPPATSTSSIVGASGTVVVMPSATAEAAPGPAALTARTSTGYVCPPTSGVTPSFDSVVMRNGDPVVPLPRVRQVAPASVEYW